MLNGYEYHKIIDNIDMRAQYRFAVCLDNDHTVLEMVQFDITKP